MLAMIPVPSFGRCHETVRDILVFPIKSQISNSVRLPGPPRSLYHLKAGQKVLSRS